MGLQHLLFPVADQYSDPNAWNSDEHFPIKRALALAAAALRCLMHSALALATTLGNVQQWREAATFTLQLLRPTRALRTRVL